MGHVCLLSIQRQSFVLPDPMPPPPSPLSSISCLSLLFLNFYPSAANKSPWFENLVLGVLGQYLSFQKVDHHTMSWDEGKGYIHVGREVFGGKGWWSVLDYVDSCITWN